MRSSFFSIDLYELSLVHGALSVTQAHDYDLHRLRAMLNGKAEPCSSGGNLDQAFGAPKDGSIQLWNVESFVGQGQGQAVAEGIRAIVITETTNYISRAEYFCLKLDHVRQLKQL